MARSAAKYTRVVFLDCKKVLILTGLERRARARARGRRILNNDDNDANDDDDSDTNDDYNI